MALWTAADISTFGWWDAADASTITIATGVSQWRDKSGNSRHAVQGTASLQPAVVASAVNGLSVLYFDASAELLVSNLPTPSTVNTFVVWNKPSAGGVAYQRIFSSGPSTGDDYAVNGVYLVCPTASTGAAAGGPGLDSQKWGGASKSLQNFYFGRANRSALSYFYGQLCEVVITPILSDDDYAKMQGYLAWKWGLQSLLATDHPYKLVAPATDTGGVVNFVEQLHVFTGVGTSIIPATGTCEFSTAIDEVSGIGTSSVPSFGEVVFSPPVDVVSGLGYSDAFASSAHFEPEVDGFSSYGFAGIVGNVVFKQPRPEFSSVGESSGQYPNGVGNFRSKVDAFYSDGYVGINGASNFSLGPGKFSANGNVNAIISGNVSFRGLKHNLNSQGSATILARASFKDTIARFSSSGVHGVIGSASLRTPVDIVRSRGAEISDHGILSYSRSDYIYPLPPGLTSPPSINPMQFVRN